MDLVVFCVLLGLSFFFSASETALFSINKVARNRLAKSESPVERLIASLIAKPGDLLITILCGNEITNVAISIVGAAITHRLAGEFSLQYQSLVSALVVVTIVVVFAEITPKTLSAHRPEVVGRLIAHPVSWFHRIFKPLRWLIRPLTASLLRRFGEAAPDGVARRHIPEEEFRALIDAGAEEGVVETQEQEFIHNVLDFGDLRVGDVMLPTEKVVSVCVDASVDEAIALAIEHGYSRLPVYRSGSRDMIGVVYAKDLLAIRWGVAQKRQRLRALVRPPVYVLSRTDAAVLLETLRRRRTHLAIVVDEFGEAVGICTMEDLLEELFGPIADRVNERKGEDA